MAAYTTAGQKVITNSQVSFLNGESVKANANTVFVLWDAKNDTYVYQGIANAPTVNVGADGKGEILVNWVVKNGYATYVFIDASDDGDAKIDDVNNVADYLFILKSTRNKTVVGEDTYYQYEVLFDGEQTTKYIEESIIDVNDAQGDMVYNVKANDKGFITSATEFEDHDAGGTKDTHEVTAMKIADKDTLTQSGRTLTITGDTDREYLVDDETVINLVVGEDCILLRDSGVKYELYQNLTASGVAGLVKGYQLTGTVYAVTDDGNSDVLDYLYVFVDAAKEVDTSVIPTLERTDDSDDTYAAGENADEVKFEVSVKNEGTMTYTVNNGSSDIKSSSVSDGDTISFYPTADGDAGVVVAGTYTVTVKNVVDGKTYTDVEKVTVTVGAATLKSFEVQSGENTYENGDSFDTSSLILKATYTDGSTKVISGASATVTPEVLTMETTEVTITYGGVKATYNVTVSAREATITASSNTATVKVGESTYVNVSVDNGGTIDATAAVTNESSLDNSKITATYADGLLTITAAADAQPGTYKITVSGKDEAGNAIGTNLEIELTVETA